MKGNRTGKGYFSLTGKERLGKALGLRLPVSIELKLREELQLNNAEINEYIRLAVAEKLERENT